MRESISEIRGRWKAVRVPICSIAATILMICIILSIGCNSKQASNGASGNDGSNAPKTLTNSIGMNFTLIQAGQFQMGSENEDREKPVHQVKLTRAFYMQTTEVTQAQWEAVMGNNPSAFKGPDLPVEKVSWEDCQEFIKRLNTKEGTEQYRLPAEAEWEYACRADTSSESEEELEEMAWGGWNSGGQTHPVGQKKPNAWGLYDMLGNVWEYCQDWYDAAYYKTSPSTDPGGPETGSLRVVRGGSWDRSVKSNFRCSYRHFIDPSSRLDYFGFRIVKSL